MTHHDWSLPHKIGFRFSFIFILSFIFLMNAGIFPRKFTYWFAENVLHHEYDNTVHITGSGDTSYAWITLLIIFVLTIMGTAIWSILDRNRRNYDSCCYWLTVIVRYYIAFMLIMYGISKLMYTQMQPPTLDRLMQPLGEFSPMGLAWTYMGYSRGYSIFMGVVEILAGLLLFRKTVALGALITMATSINIMAVNYFFDVPVKMMATALFVLSLFLLIPYIKPLFQLLVQGKQAQLQATAKPKWSKSWKKRFVTIKITFIGIFLISQLIAVMDKIEVINQSSKETPLYGIYFIESHDDNRTFIPNDWFIIIFEHERRASVRDKHYKKTWEKVILDSEKKKINLNNYILDYTVMQNGDILLTKTVAGYTEEVKLVKQKPEEFELIKRGFNWIQEHPYNR